MRKIFAILFSFMLALACVAGPKPVIQSTWTTVSNASDTITVSLLTSNSFIAFTNPLDPGSLYNEPSTKTSCLQEINNMFPYTTNGITAGGVNIYVNPGVFPLTAKASMTNNFMIQGAGRWNTLFWYTGNSNANTTVAGGTNFPSGSSTAGTITSVMIDFEDFTIYQPSLTISDCSFASQTNVPLYLIQCAGQNFDLNRLNFGGPAYLVSSNADGAGNKGGNWDITVGTNLTYTVGVVAGGQTRHTFNSCAFFGTADGAIFSDPGGYYTTYATELAGVGSFYSLADEAREWGTSWPSNTIPAIGSGFIALSGTDVHFNDDADVQGSSWVAVVCSNATATAYHLTGQQTVVFQLGMMPTATFNIIDSGFPVIVNQTAAGNFDGTFNSSYSANQVAAVTFNAGTVSITALKGANQLGLTIATNGVASGNVTIMDSLGRIVGKGFNSQVTTHVPHAVSVGASPFSFVNNTTVALECYLTGNSTYSVTKNGTSIYNTGCTNAYFVLMPTNACVITYGTAPTFNTNAW